MDSLLGIVKSTGIVHVQTTSVEGSFEMLKAVDNQNQHD